MLNLMSCKSYQDNPPGIQNIGNCQQDCVVVSKGFVKEAGNVKARVIELQERLKACQESK